MATQHLAKIGGGVDRLNQTSCETKTKLDRGKHDGVMDESV